MLTFDGEGLERTDEQALEAFATKLEQHPHGETIEGRLVIAEMRPAGPTASMKAELPKWMKDEDHERWVARQEASTVFTVGKTFVADDEVVTAVVFALPHDRQGFLDIAAHELVEMAGLRR